RPISPCVDLGVVRTWLQECRDHKACNENRRSQQSNLVQFFASGFRLIDVMEGKLVKKTDPREYIALSYVWGQLEPPPLRTNKQNLSALHEPSSLYPLKEDQSATEQIPRTIADAIALCRSIGKRYLWVDSICIVQDDMDEKRRLIHGMDRVYENASLTVVALSGSDAAAGLAGITHRGRDNDNDRRRHLFHEGHRTHCIGISRMSLEEHVRSSHWNTRGWTYQERLLTPRKLYFSSNEVFYECAEGAPWYGRSFVKHSTAGNSLYSTLPKSWELRSHDKEFRDIVSIYTRKSLTEPGDILNALTGIYHKFYNSAGIQGPGIHGLQGNPMQCFFRSLFWFTPGGRHERRSMVNGVRPSSWSWTSFNAPVDF
ncbi:heterokaryon incompatibility protein-domain-containing protein, partial [Diaporthe sp. PMI_573]